MCIACMYRYAELLYDVAVVSSGYELDDPSAFAKRVVALMEGGEEGLAAVAPPKAEEAAEEAAEAAADEFADAPEATVEVAPGVEAPADDDDEGSTPVEAEVV